MSTNPTYPTERGTRATNPSTTTYGSSAASGPAPTTAGPHTHDVLNKLDPTTDSTRDRERLPSTQGQPLVGDYSGGAPSHGAYPPTHTTHHGTRPGEGGVGGAAPVAGGPGSVAEQQRLHRQHEHGGGHLAGETAHKSEILNKLDPRVDSKTGTWKQGSSGTGGV
ncbi:hypothetical protein C8A05DRAFT_31754 [Staphylotrichum tortipilum]|uniref:Uncharacterized protein n=1 Tax=Staphylotrichum tortipilum TaxID=2831512 RepID=A0AAN6MP27_9PEZI|nr:hypothetical protein C8A05DRAFT_31754 [Staphylotrichum longicolle]